MAFFEHIVPYLQVCALIHIKATVITGVFIDIGFCRICFGLVIGVHDNTVPVVDRLAQHGNLIAAYGHICIFAINNRAIDIFAPLSLLKDIAFHDHFFAIGIEKVTATVMVKVIVHDPDVAAAVPFTFDINAKLW